MKNLKTLLYLAFITFTISACVDDDSDGQLGINFKLTYNDSPLVMAQNYEYPDGRKVSFTRCSFYISDVKLGNTIINEIEYHNLTNYYTDATNAAKGYVWTIDSIPSGSYSSLSFDIGVPQELNAMVPAEFPSDHPLSNTAENWFGWSSYIFFKVEGNIDMDNDGTKETAIALHIGADEAFRSFSLDRNISITSGDYTETDVNIDVYDFFNGTDRIYPIDDNPQIHSVSQKDAVLELADNLMTAIK